MRNHPLSTGAATGLSRRHLAKTASASPRYMTAGLLWLCAFGCVESPDPGPGDAGDTGAATSSDADATPTSDTGVAPASDTSADISADAAPKPQDAGGSAPDVSEPDVGLGKTFPAFTSCPQTWASKPFDWLGRPSSGRVCAVYPGPGVTNATFHACLPWEWCHRGFVGTLGQPPSEWQPTGSLRCKRRCGATATCPSGTSCVTATQDDGDVSHKRLVCPIHPAPGAFPAYQTGAPEPAEGGLACWASLVQVEVPSDNLRMARVGAHVYLLLYGAQTGTPQNPNTPVVSHRLMHIGLSATMTATDLSVVDVVKPGSAAIIGVMASGEDLVAFRRPASPTLGFDKPAVVHTVLAGTPNTDGSVVLKDTGLTVALAFGANATLTGSRHGCLLVPHGKDLARVCFVREAGIFVKKVIPLQLPALAQTDLAAGAKSHGRRRMVNLSPWRAAVSDHWIAVATGSLCDGELLRLHVAPFNRQANLATGGWTTTPVLGSWLGATKPELTSDLCAPIGPLWMSGDVLYTAGMTTRITQGKPGVWRAGTVIPSGFGPLTGWDDIDGVLLAAVRISTSGPIIPVALLATRVLW